MASGTWIADVLVRTSHERKLAKLATNRIPGSKIMIQQTFGGITMTANIALKAIK